MTELVTISVEAHIADVRLNRPDKRNALSPAMFDAVSEAARSLACDRRIRAVVLSGEGKAFCAGLDLENFTDPAFQAGGFPNNPDGRYPNRFQAPGYLWKAVPVPVICALHGVAFGGGLQIALGADIRLAAPGTRLSVMEIQWGLLPDMSATQTLRDLVRLDVAKELAFTGRVVEAGEAAALGLITRVVDDPRAAAFELARAVADRNPDAISLSKYLFDGAWHGDAEAGLCLEEQAQALVLAQDNQREAALAALEGRPGEFSERCFADYEALAARLRGQPC